MNEMNLRETLEYLVDTGYALAEAKQAPVVTMIEGETYCFYHGSIRKIEKKELKPAPSVFRAYTLDGLIDWIRSDVDHFFDNPEETCVVNVISPTSIELTTPCKGIKNDRQLLAVCQYDAPVIRFDTFMDSEDFGIMLQTSFVEDDNRNVVLQITRNMTEEQSEQTADDGISQRVSIKHGVQAIDSAVFRNPAYLRPMRTFTEVEQPGSPFVVRFKEGKRAALFEADGGAWKVFAVKAIGEYLKGELSGLNLVVVA